MSSTLAHSRANHLKLALEACVKLLLVFLSVPLFDSYFLGIILFLASSRGVSLLSPSRVLSEPQKCG